MIPEPETVPCKCCGNPTTYTGTQLCNNCWEFITRIDRFISSPKGLNYVLHKIKQQEIDKWKDKWNEKLFNMRTPDNFELLASANKIIKSMDDDTNLRDWKYQIVLSDLSAEIVQDAINNRLLWI